MFPQQTRINLRCDDWFDHTEVLVLSGPNLIKEEREGQVLISQKVVASYGDGLFEEFMEKLQELDKVAWKIWEQSR